MKLRIIIPLIILLLFSYLVFIFPFETILSWLGRTTSYQETILSTAIVYLVCLFYFRSKSSNKLIKFFVYEGMGIGAISLFIVSFILVTSLVTTISDTKKIFIYLFIFFPSIVYGFINAKYVSIKQLKFSHSKIKKNLSFVFLTDIHIGSNSPKILKKIVLLINQQNPRFVLIGGDLIDSSSFKIHDLDEIKISMPLYIL